MKKWLFIIVGIFLIFSSLSQADHQDQFLKNVNTGFFKFSSEISVQFTSNMNLGMANYSIFCSYKISNFIKKGESFPVHDIECVEKTRKVTVKSSRGQITCHIPEDLTGSCDELKVSHVNKVLQDSYLPIKLIFNY